MPWSLQVLPGSWCSQPFVAFHQINAFEERGCVVLDLCCQDEGTSLALYTLQNLRRTGEGLDQVRSLPCSPSICCRSCFSKLRLGECRTLWGQHSHDSMKTEMIIS